MNNREAFEAWARKELLPLDRRDSEHYRYNLTNRAWAGWKAGLASQAAELSSNPLQLELEPYAYDVPTKDGTELAYAIYFTKYNNPLPEGAIPLYTSQQEPVRPWICPNFMLPPRSEEVLVYPMPNNVAHTAFHDGECWRVTEYEDNYGYSLVALPDGFIKGWMPIPPAPEGDKP